MPDRIEQRVTEILVAVGRLDPAQLSAGTDLAALGLDSIVMVEVIFALEEAFDISIPFATGEGPMRAQDLTQMVRDLVRVRG